MHRYLLFFTLLFCGISYAQPGISKIESIEGKKFYLHEVKSGNTLWGISQLYSVEVSEIVESNPELVNGLKEGQTIYIPVQENQVELEKPELTEHKVKKDETLFGISRQYNTTIDNLIAWNPGVENGLQIGQKILVPKIKGSEESNGEEQNVNLTPNPFVTENIELNDSTTVEVAFSDSVIRHVVTSQETMYSISNRFMAPINTIMEMNGLTSTTLKEGQVLLIPVKNEEFNNVTIREVPVVVEDSIETPVSFESKDSYNIVLLLPFYVGGGQSTEYVSSVSTELYMGALMAVDTLESMGLRAKLSVLDTRNDSATVAKLVSTSELKNADLIIGPLFGKTMQQVARFCKSNKTRMICPISSDNKLLKDNPYVYSSVSSDRSLYTGMGEYLASHSAFDRVVFIDPSDETGKQNLAYVRSGFLDHQKDGGPTLSNAGLDNFSSYVKKGERVAFIYPTENKAKATNFMSKVNTRAFKAKEGEVSVFGAKEWTDIDDLNNFYKNKYGFHYAGPNYLDYYTDEMKLMNEMFRKRFNTDLTKISVQGYDVMLYYCSSFFLNNSDVRLLMNSFHPKQLSPGSGYDNSVSFIIGQENYELIQRDKIIR